MAVIIDGYVINQRGNKINIKPLFTTSTGYITFGLGNAVFTVDPLHPFSIMTYPISGDASGALNLDVLAENKPFVEFQHRGAVEIQRTITDANGKSYTISTALLQDYKEKNRMSTYFYGSGIQPSGRSLGRLNW